MTDDEINRRVAEIEGWKELPPGSDMSVGNVFLAVTTVYGDGEIHHDGWPSFATDWQWCGPLIVKYGLVLMWTGNWPDDVGWRVEYADHAPQYFVDADTPQRAICLAVIAQAEQPA